MQKYRTLSNTELKEFEEEFISFLVVNGIEVKQWEALKADNKEKAEGIIDQFSDVIFESIFRKTLFIDHVSSKSIKCFQFLAKEIVLVGLDANENSEINFLGEQTLDSIIINNSDDLQIYQTKKKYAKVREMEMFDMVNRGANLSKGKLFKQISLLL